MRRFWVICTKMILFSSAIYAVGMLSYFPPSLKKYLFDSSKKRPSKKEIFLSQNIRPFLADDSRTILTFLRQQNENAKITAEPTLAELALKDKKAHEAVNEKSSSAQDIKNDCGQPYQVDALAIALQHFSLNGK